MSATRAHIQNAAIIAVVIVLQQCTATVVKFRSEDCTEMHEPKLRRSCCQLPRDDAVIAQCERDLLTVRPNEATHMQRIRDDKVALHLCVAECEFKAKSFLVAQYEVNMTAIEADLNQRHADDLDYVETMLYGFRACLQFARNKTREIEWLRGPDNCDFFPATLLACATERLYERCPPRRWNATPDCAAMRQFLLKCNELEQH